LDLIGKFNSSCKEDEIHPNLHFTLFQISI
jgi:hypothetical protein